MAFELDLIRWLQSFQNGFLDALFQFFTAFGEEFVIIGVLGYLYWCHDKKIGEYVGVTVFVSQFLNSMVKTVVQRPRPFVADPVGIENIRPKTATGYAFPSGHTQGAATVFGSLAVWFRKRWLPIAAGVVIFVVALSRMYLGAHYLTDVLVGGALGVAIAIGFGRMFSRHPEKTRAMYGWIAAGSAFLTVVLLVWRFFTTEAEGELTDAANFYDKMEGSLKMVGSMIGFVLGIWFESKKVSFANHRIIWKNLIRFAGGVAVVMGVRYGLGFLFDLIVKGEALPEGQKALAVLAVLFDGIRYAAMTFVAIGVYPLLFRKWNY